MLLGYVRVSSAEQRKGTSLSEQERIIKAIALAQGLGEFDVAIYRDDGVSGSVPLRERPAGRRMLDSAQSGDTIVAKTLDRAFRDAKDALEIFEHCRRSGINLIVYDLGHESVIKDGVSKMLFTILGAVAEMERGRIHERVQSGKRAKKLKGGHVGGLPPYGFRIVGSGREAKLEIDEVEQQTVATIRRVHKASPTLGEAARELTRLGITNRLGGQMSKMQVKRLVERV